MKKISKQRKVKFIDILKWLSILIMHNVGLWIYISILLLSNELIKHNSYWWLDLHSESLIFSIFMYVFCQINAILQIIYRETGNLIVKGTLWILIFTIIITVPSYIFNN